jgi:hypothetical protein
MSKSVNPGSTITGCTFNGVQWDAKAVETITIVATACKENAIALQENAKTLHKLAEVLNSSNVKIDTMLKLQN